MKSFHLSSTSLAAVACFAFASTSTHGVEIFSASTSNITAIANAPGGTQMLPTITGATPDLIVTNAAQNNTMAGFASTDDINTLNGTALTAADTVTISLTVDSMADGVFRANGFEFGLAGSAGFRPAVGSLLLGMAGSNSGSDVRITSSFQDDGTLDFNSNQAALLDGFSITLTANAAGYSFLLEDILVAGSTNPLYTNGDTTATISGTFAGTEFLDNFGTGRFYAAVQQQNANQMVTDYSLATIDVTVVLDTDGDGMPDSYEDVTPGHDKTLAADASQGANDGLFDNDGRTNLEEFLSGTDPNIADVDMDDLNDGEEFAEGTNPFVADSDGDLLNDGQEVNGDLNPFQVGHVAGNTPGGIPGERTNPLVADTDGDNISDFEELDGSNGSITNPNTNDTDGDTLFDDEEVNSGLDPNDPNGANGADGDPDGDLLSNLDEVIAGTDPFLADTDGDDINDKQELDGALNPFQAGHIPGDTPAGVPGEPTDPLLADSDGDGLSDKAEVENLNGSVTNPNSGDTDGDNFQDFIEIEAGSLPNDASSTPSFPTITWSAQELDEETDLSTGGSLLFADNFDGEAVTINGIPFIGRSANSNSASLSSPQFQTQLQLSSSSLNLPTLYDNEVPALAPLVTTFWFGNSSITNSDSFGITGLTPGLSYLVEFGQVDDRTGSIIDRYRLADSFGGGAEADPIGANNLTYGGPGNPAILVTGTFTASHSVQAFRSGVYSNADNLEGSQIAFIQVREIELPSEIQVCDIRPTGSTVEVDFAGLDLTKSYQLVRSTDLQDSFPTIVDGPRAPAAAADTFEDLSPLAIKAFYQLEEIETP